MNETTYCSCAFPQPKQHAEPGHNSIRCVFRNQVRDCHYFLPDESPTHLIFQNSDFAASFSALGLPEVLLFSRSDNFTSCVADGNHLPQAAADLLAQIERLAAAPTNAKNILVVDDYGFGTHSAIGDAWKQAVFTGLITLRAQGLNVAFVDFSPLWDAVLGTTPPGFAAFGYKNPGNCIPNADQTTLAGECATPLQSFYWLPS